MNKRGQFYLIAAVVIAGLIVGMGMNYTSINGSSNDDSTDKILLQIQSEASQVIDNAVFNGLSNSERNANLDLLLGAYSQNNPDTEFVLIFGSKEEIQAETEYNKYYSLVGNERVVSSAGLSFSGDKSTVSLSEDEKYDFQLKQQNLYLIVKTIREEESNVRTNN